MVRLLVFLAMVLLVCRSGMAAPSCTAVQTMISPCIPYMTDKSADVTPACCNGAVGVKNMDKTPADREAICQCLKDALNHLPGVDVKHAQDIPKKCGVKIDIPIGKDVDCTKSTA